MSASIPTMRVTRKSDGASCNINECDFDSSLYTKTRAAKPESEPAAGKSKGKGKPSKKDTPPADPSTPKE